MDAKTRLFALPMAALLLLASTSAAHASTIWNGDAAGGTGIFGNLNCDSPGSITAVDEPGHGKVWKYAKPGGSNRCENHGISVGGKRYVFKGGETYYFGWQSKLSSTVNNNANFQWKSYGHHTQNFPVVLKMIGGRMSMLQSQPTGSDKIIWSAPITANTWHDYTIGLYLSSATTGGWVELYLDGKKQTFTNGTQRYACRTLDDINEPKWGVYGANGTSVTNYVDALKVGTTYEDVAP
ncbi:Polysaccharide lyase [Amycolatopsis xylanica]|uniref:Polysaccharide lyase n=1 Tax=Amycolatopsis xylanica TaxID=589385 RepID=A0A1H2T6G1_9PSEU|nr:heparin lyase I family protein [Amycolatopsis xylanica]SDW39357.1 Polysaccharide lyase [Amycolatopsis xylanica]